MARRTPPRLGVERLEARDTPANLKLTNALLVDGHNAPQPNPVFGQNTFTRAEWASQGMSGFEPAVPVRYTAHYPAGYFTASSPALDLPADSGQTIYHGTGNGTWSWYRGGLWAGTQPFTITVTLDPDNQIAETNEADNSQTLTVTPVAPAGLPFKFYQPIGKTPNRDWGITNYADVDPRDGVFKDYRLGDYTYDGHDAIDAGPPDFAAQDRGLPVTADAAGTVDEVDGGEYFDRETSFYGGQNWNGVWVDHGNGWRTTYGHLAAGSITVKVGDRVDPGQILGLMGSSGISTGTHTHTTAYYRGAQVEFGFAPDSYWAAPLPYAGDVPGFTFGAGVTTGPFTNAELQERPSQYTSVGTTAPGNVLVYFYVQGYNLKTTDTLYWQFVRPNGTVLTTTQITPSVSYHFSTWATGLNQSSFQSAVGTWQVVSYLNGTTPDKEQRRVTFEVVAGLGAGSIRATDDATNKPLIAGRTTAIDFGTVAAGTAAVDHTFTVYNTASGPLDLTGYSAPPGFVLVSPPASVPAGGSRTLTVRMSTSAAGAKYGTVRFSTTDPDTPVFEFVVAGTVTGNPPPAVITLPGPALAYPYGSGPVLLAPAATVSYGGSLAAASLRVEFAAFGGSFDALRIRDQGTGAGQIGAANGVVTYGGVPVGTYSYTGSAPVSVTFNSSATVAAVQALVRNLTYENGATQATTQRVAVRVTLFGATGPASNLAVQHVINSGAPAPRPPQIVSPAAVGFVRNTNGSFEVQAYGVPVPLVSVAGRLPAGVTFDPATKRISGTPTEFGTFRLTVTAANGVGDPVTQALTLTVPPAVAGFVVNRGQAQRSYVRYLDVTLDSGTTAAALLGAGRLRLVRRDLAGNNPLAIPLADWMLSAAGAVLKVNFGSQGLGGNRNANAADGYYTLGLDLDGNGSWETGQSFYRLMGDTNGDRKADQADVDRVAAGLPPAAFAPDLDVNGDGAVNTTDKLLAQRNRGHTLAAGLPLDG